MKCLRELKGLNVEENRGENGTKRRNRGKLPSKEKEKNQSGRWRTETIYDDTEEINEKTKEESMRPRSVRSVLGVLCVCVGFVCCACLFVCVSAYALV